MASWIRPPVLSEMIGLAAFSTAPFKLISRYNRTPSPRRSRLPRRSNFDEKVVFGEKDIFVKEMLETYNKDERIIQKTISNLTNPYYIVLSKDLPTRIVSLQVNDNAEIEMYMDNGWQVNFSLHKDTSGLIPNLTLNATLVGAPLSYRTILRREAV